MEQVALSLQKWAVERRRNLDDFDLYGRSAFNRYYYASFLTVRELIVEFEPQWAGGHSTVPEFLTGSIEREIKRFRTSAQKRQQPDAVELCNRAVTALASLSSLMQTAYSIRVTADYNPQIRVVDSDKDRFTLGTTSITDAHNWVSQTRTLTQVIRRAWRLARGLT